MLLPSECPETEAAEFRRNVVCLFKARTAGLNLSDAGIRVFV
jgi:hypothetical protein